MSAPSPAAPDPSKPQPTVPPGETAVLATSSTVSQSVLPNSFHAHQPRGHAEANWRQAFASIPLEVQSLLLKSRCTPDTLPPWLNPAWTSRSSRLGIQASPGPLFPPLPKEWAEQYTAMLAQKEWETAPRDPRQDWRFLAMSNQHGEWTTEPAEPRHPPLLIAPGPQVWLTWTALSHRDAPSEAVLLLCATPDAPKRGEVLRVWHQQSGWERTMSLIEDSLHLEASDDPDMIAICRLLQHQGRIFTETPPQGA